MKMLLNTWLSAYQSFLIFGLSEYVLEFSLDCILIALHTYYLALFESFVYSTWFALVLLLLLFCLQ
jgi:hypothetical protein